MLNEVQRLQDLMDVKGDMSYTCETAMHFFWSHVLPKWNKYLTTMKSLEENSDGVSLKMIVSIKLINNIYIFRLFQSIVSRTTSLSIFFLVMLLNHYLSVKLWKKIKKLQEVVLGIHIFFLLIYLSVRVILNTNLFLNFF